MTTIIEQIDTLHKKMKQVQRSLSKFGATDTEPDTVYEFSVRNAIKGHKFENLTSDDWELYTIEGREATAVELNKHTEAVTQMILSTPLSERQNLIQWAKEKLWRVDTDFL